MAKRKKAPSVKIPASVLKREAEKMAKQMIRKEELKEKKRLQREKVKEKAKAKVKAKTTKQKKIETETADLYDNDFTRELWGSLWVGWGVIMIVIMFWGDGSLAEWFTQDVMRALFGSVMYIIPFVLMAFGFSMFLFRDFFFPPLRVLAWLTFFVSLCGLVNLWVPLDESLALAKDYGGALGFAIGFLPREFLGNVAAGAILLVLFWISGMTGLGLTVSDVRELVQRFRRGESLLSDEKVEVKAANKKSAKALKAAEKPEKAKPAKPPRFQNEVEIIDSTGRTEAKKPEPQKVQLEPKEDALTTAKNKEFGHWEAPSLDLLEEKRSTITVDEKKLRQKAEAIREKLEQFGIQVTMRSVHVGPTVTQFTLEPAAGVKLNKITALKSDLALALAATNVRIEAPIRGQKLVGIEIPNEKRAIVSMREILESEPWEEQDSALKLAVGRGVDGKPIIVDLQKMPHLLIAGKTGSGKSVAMNAFLMSLLWNNAPDKLRMILIDPKRVELAPYNHLPHLLTPVITEPEKSVSALAWAVAEMNRRYKDFAQKGCRNLNEHNEKFPDNPEPYIVIVVDELADLMMVAGKDVEAAICRIAQMARAVGMHLIIATQRPSVDVVTGLIKANLPARIAFRVSSGIDSRTIIDGIGAEDLLGMGDMLYMDGNSGELTRIQGLYVSTKEVESITNNIKLQFPEQIGQDEIQEEITSQSIEGMAKGGVLTAGMGKDLKDEDLDKKFEEAVNVVLQNEKASASFLQRRLEVGYARAARILDQMEAKGIIGPSKGAKPRDIYGRQE